MMSQASTGRTGTLRVTSASGKHKWNLLPASTFRPSIGHWPQHIGPNPAHLAAWRPPANSDLTCPASLGILSAQRLGHSGRAGGQAAVAAQRPQLPPLLRALFAKCLAQRSCHSGTLL